MRESQGHKTVGPIRTKQLLERIHCDLVGPTKPPIPGTNILVVTNNYTRYMSAKPLKTKDETTNALVEILNILEKGEEQPLKMIQADWGGEFCNKDLRTVLRQRGIQLKETEPRHSESKSHHCYYE